MIYALVTVKSRADMLVKCIESMQSELVNITVLMVGNDSNVLRAVHDMLDAEKINSVARFDGAFMSGELYGASLMAEHNHIHDCDLIYFCACDYVMYEGWIDKIESFLAMYQPIVASLELEPLFPWNAPIKHVVINGGHGIARASLPGANWIMRYDTFKDIKPVMEKYQCSLTHDLDVCKELLATHGLVALNLADHIGAYDSSNGNQAFQVNAKPLPDEWKV